MLDPELQLLLKLSRSQSYPSISTLDVAAARRNVSRLASFTALPPTEVGRVKDLVIPADQEDSIPLRIFWPAEKNEEVTTSLPVLVYFHGGGFVLYDINDYDSFGRFLCASAGIVVVLVGYRLAPEYIFPRQYLDSVAALQWVHANAGQLGIDPACISVGGDSVGGNLAAALAKDRQGHGVPIFLQLLIYPVLVFRKLFLSYKEYGTGYFLDSITMDWFWNLFHDPSCTDMEKDARIAPYLTKESPDLPPIIMVISEFDVLRDEALDYYQRRKERKGKDQLLYFGNLGHNFILMAGRIKAARLAVEKIARALNEKYSHQRNNRL